MINDNDKATRDDTQQAAGTGGDRKVSENKAVTQADSQPADELMKKFTKADSTDEIKHTAKKVIDADDDIDVNKLEQAGTQFQKEKQDDKSKEAANDAQFAQPDN